MKWIATILAVTAATTANPHPPNVNFSPDAFTNCVRFQAPAGVTAVKAAELSQSFPAEPYIGKTVVFQGWLAVRDDGAAAIELRLRVDHRDGRREFFDGLDGPVETSTPQRREARGYVADDAVSIEIRARYMAGAPAWVFDPSFVVSDSSNAEEGNVRAFIRQFNAARNAHDGTAVAAFYTVIDSFDMTPVEN